MPKPPSPESGHNQALDKCLRVFENELHFTNPSPLFLMLGTIAANYLKGDPVWLMLVGPPSCGKNVCLLSTDKLPNMHYVSLVKNVAAFITFNKDGGQGGLLSRIGKRGFVVLKDFTSILSLDRDNMKEVMGVLRECYDGKYSRGTGDGGGKALSWAGKLCVLAGCTFEIDTVMGQNQALGERFIYYRYENNNERDSFQQALSVLSRAGEDPQDSRESLSTAVKELFDSLELSWKMERKDLTDKEKTRIGNLVVMACKLRTVIRRHSFKDSEVVAPPQQEYAGRLAEVMGNLYRGMQMIGVSESWCWQLLKKVALDSGPMLRVEVLRGIDGANVLGLEATTDLLATQIKVSKSAISKTIQDLNFCNLIYKGDNKQWHVVDSVKRILGW